MKRFQAKLCTLAAALAVVAAGCGDRANPSAPEPTPRAELAGDTSTLLGETATVLSSSLEAVQVLRRTSSLKEDVSASALLGAAGGTIEIPEAGIAVSFPAGSLPVDGDARMPITVTAVRGNGVAYLFAPHGTVFRGDVTVTQSLKSTGAFRKAAVAGRLQAAYFPHVSALSPDGTARVQELRPTAVDVEAGSMSWTIRHFSGYLASVGRGAESSPQ